MNSIIRGSPAIAMAVVQHITLMEVHSMRIKKNFMDTKKYCEYIEMCYDKKFIIFYPFGAFLRYISKIPCCYLDAFAYYILYLALFIPPFVKDWK